MNFFIIFFLGLFFCLKANKIEVTYGSIPYRTSFPSYVKLVIPVDLSFTITLFLDFKQIIHNPPVNTNNRIVNNNSNEQKASYESTSDNAVFTVVFHRQFQKTIYSFFGSFQRGRNSYSLEPYEDGVSKGHVKIMFINTRKYKLTIQNLKNQGGFSEGGSGEKKDLDELIRLLSTETQDKEKFKNPPPFKQNLVIELLVVIDASLYYKWLKFHKMNENQTKVGLISFYLQVMNGVNMRYKKIQHREYSLSVVTSGFFIITKKNQSPLIDYLEENLRPVSSIEAETGLNHFHKWILDAIRNKKFKNLPGFDSALFLTDINMNRVTGMAFVDSTCTSNGVIIVRDNSQLEITCTITHELGHNMGAYHDGTSGNKCDSQDQFIMATYIKKLNSQNYNNSISFSSCSLHYFQQYIRKLDATNKNCLKKTGEDITKKYNLDLSSLPGQLYSVDDQCRLLFGGESYHCGGTGVCKELSCFNPKNRDCDVIDRQRAADGTTCGNKMWCIEGFCVYDEKALETETDKCVHGEFKEAFNNMFGTHSCGQLTEKESYVCYQPIVQEKCCKSCPKLKKFLTKGCEWGDRDRFCEMNVKSHPYQCRINSIAVKCCLSCHKYYFNTSIGIQEKGLKINIPNYCKDEEGSCNYLRPRDCYEQSFLKQCCSSCTLMKNTKKRDCFFGDKLSICSSELCSQSSESCCQTCSV